MRPIAVLDACVLYPYHLRDFLIRLSISGNMYQPRWSDDIHEEWTRNLLMNRPELNKEALKRTVALMNRLPETLVRRDRYQYLIDQCVLPDPDDRHVLAAAIECDANFIITFNLRDFPAKILAENKIEAIHPDDFVLKLAEISPESVLFVLQEQVSSMKNSPMALHEFVETLRNLGLVKSMKIVDGVIKK